MKPIIPRGRSAELIIAEELKRGRWQEAELKTRPKGDSVKVALAARWQAETTMTVGWIDERLTMGTRGYLNHLLYRRRKLRASKQYQELTPFNPRVDFRFLDTSSEGP